MTPSPRPTATPEIIRDVLRHWGIQADAVSISPLPSDRDLNLKVDSAGEPGAGDRLVAESAITAASRDRVETRANTFPVVLKIANPGDAPRARLDLERRLLECARSANSGHDTAVPVPSVIPTSNGAAMVEVEDVSGRTCWARCVSWLPGRLMADAIHSDSLLAEVGTALGRLDHVLVGAVTPGGQLVDLPPDVAAALDRPLAWDLDQGVDVATDHLLAIPNAKARALVRRTLERVTETLESLGPLPRSIIHNDANDHNLLVRASGARPNRKAQRPKDTGPTSSPRRERFEPNCLSGLLDFGDAVRASTVNELAIAAAYALFGRHRRHPHDPVARILPMVRAYHAEHPLSEDEIDALFAKMMLRLAVSVAFNARQRQSEPEDPYLSVTEAGAWSTLQRFDEIPWRRSVWRLRAACGLEAVRGSRATVAALRSVPVAPVLGGDLGGDAPRYRLLDLSLGAESLVGFDPHDQDQLTRTVSQELGYDVGAAGSRPADGLIGWGRYGEARPLYVGNQFGATSPADTEPLSQTSSAVDPHRADAASMARSPDPTKADGEGGAAGRDPDLKPIAVDNGKADGGAVAAVEDGAEPRTVHLGVDLFAPPGEPVFAPLDGVIHSFRDNALANDYGPTILLEHQIDARRFLTLYGHLSRESLEGLEVGRRFAAGERLAELGTSAVNGGWTPHLHFQILLDDLGCSGNFPGVGEYGQLAAWMEACPDPNLLLRWHDQATGKALHDPGALLSRRRRVLAPSLSLSYERPLHITRGRGAFLIEDTGHRFLDLVNNVAHVGHCHPRVVRALSRQAATLNTNSRYLHRNVVDYAERLLATLAPTHAAHADQKTLDSGPDLVQARGSDPLEVCFFVNSGSEANDLALRIARTATGRLPVICMEGAYHGHLTSTLEISPYKHDGPGGRGTPEHIHKVSMPDTYRGKHRLGARSETPSEEDSVDSREAIRAIGGRYAQEVEEVVARHSIAAFIGEPILSCGGQIDLPEGYLRRVYRAVRNQGGLCIADEVQVGFGRVGSHFWGFETQGVVPDIVTLGKPIGNGHPLAAVVTTRRLAEAFANGMEYFNTYGGNPVSCAVGLAVLDVIEDEELQRRAARLGSHFLEGLHALANRWPVIGDVRGRGLFLGFELVADPEQRTPDPELAWYLVQWMRERGFLLSTDGPANNVVKIKPPMVLGIADIDATLAALRGFFRQVLG